MLKAVIIRKSNTRTRKDSTQSNYNLVPRLSPLLAPWNVKRGDPGNKVDQIYKVLK